MFNVNFEITQLQGAIKKQQLEIKALQDKLEKLLNSKVKVSSVLKSQQKEFEKLAKENERLRNKMSQKIFKKELSCMQEVEFTDENIERVKEMAICMSKEQIARRFNMSLTTYVKREEQIPELKEAFEVGCATFMQEATNKLVEHIRKDDTKLLQYYLDNVMKMRQQDQTQITISQEFIDKKLTIVNDNLNSDDDFENEIKKKFHNQIMSITISKDNQNENDKE